MLPSSSYEANLDCREEAATIKDVAGSKTMLEYALGLGTERIGKCPSKSKSGIHSIRLGPCGYSLLVQYFCHNRILTSSEYRRKSPLDSQSEHAVKACTTEWPDGIILTPPLSVAKIQHGRSPVKNTPEKDFPGAGEVTNGISCLEIRLCSAMTVFSTSSGC